MTVLIFEAHYKRNGEWKSNSFICNWAKFNGSELQYQTLDKELHYLQEARITAMYHKEVVDALVKMLDEHYEYIVPTQYVLPVAKRFKSVYNKDLKFAIERIPGSEPDTWENVPFTKMKVKTVIEANGIIFTTY